MQRTSFTIAALLSAASGTALASNDTGSAMAQVLSSTPVLQQLTVSRPVCHNVTVATPAPPSGTGALVGAWVGGVLGHAIGHNGPRAATTVMGAAIGAAVGSQVAAGPATAQQVQQCETQTHLEYRVTGFNVVYEYAGRRYTTHRPEDPGATLRVQVSPLTDAAEPTVVTAQVAVIEPMPLAVYHAPNFYVHPAWFHMTLGGVRHWR